VRAEPKERGPRRGGVVQVEDQVRPRIRGPLRPELSVEGPGQPGLPGAGGGNGGVGGGVGGVEGLEAEAAVEVLVDVSGRAEGGGWEIMRGGLNRKGGVSSQVLLVST
jgi:hypothetical protein